MSYSDWSYIARTRAGLVVAAVVEDTPFAARDVADWMRDGMVIERVPVKWVREHLFTTETYTPEPAP